MIAEKDIGNAIRKLRGDLSLREFAQKCNVSHTTIDNLEKGVDFRTNKPTQVKVSTLLKISAAFNVPIEYFFYTTDELIKKEPVKKTGATQSRFTDHELNIINAYRAQPDLQTAVDRLLGVESDGKIFVYTAAYSDDKRPDAYVQIDKDIWEKIQDAPETDDTLT